jgi:uncharacterized protein YbbC (DUF1343 family)
MTRVETGLEVFLKERARELEGRRVGLVAHAASVDAGLTSAVRLFAACPHLRLTALFGPEHGLLTGAQDMVAVGNERDQASGLKVHTLYGDTEASLRPTPEMLDEIDVLVADLQDVGARYYTFAATVALALEAGAAAGRRMIVLDRPNPIGGEAVEGPALGPKMRSFVGYIEAPVRHGTTIGELLGHHARSRGLEKALDVVPMRGWRREMSFEDTGLPWIPPSPNMPTPDTARVYPGACLVEGTNLSEGRGTTRPFEWIGAPFLDSVRTASLLNGWSLPGVVFRPISFVPAFHKWAGRLCGGVAVHVVDRARFRPVRTGVALLVAAKRLAPADFAWRSEPYEFVSDRPAIDLLAGDTLLREGIDAGADTEEIACGWTAVETSWREERAQSLLY